MKNKLAIIDAVIEEIGFDQFYAVTIRPNEIVFQAKYEPSVVKRVRGENLWSKWTISEQTGYIESRKSFPMADEVLGTDVITDVILVLT